MRLVLALMIVLGVALASLGVPVTATIVRHAAEYRTPAITGVVIGAVVGALFAVIGRASGQVRFLDTLCHEASHAIWAFLVGGHVQALTADADLGGHTQFVIPKLLSPVRSFLVAIAPYWCCPIILVAALVLPTLEPLRGDAALAEGSLFGYALVQPLLQWHARQTDLRVYGVLPALIVVASLWTGALTLTTAALTMGTARGMHAVYVGSARLLGVTDPERQVRRAEAEVGSLVHPRWLSLVRAAANEMSESRPTRPRSRQRAGKPRP